MPLGHDQCGLCAAPFDQGIGCEGGAVGDEGDIGRRDAGLRKQVGNALHESFCRIPGRQDLGGVPCSARLQDRIGKGPTDINGNPWRAAHVFSGAQLNRPATLNSGGSRFSCLPRPLFAAAENHDRAVVHREWRLRWTGHNGPVREGA